MYTALIDPPYELPAKVAALQSELFTLLMKTLTPLAVVSADVLLLLLLLLALNMSVELLAYPPR